MAAKRRPIKTRDARLAQNAARWLSRSNISPNQISVASVFFAALAALCFYLLPGAGGMAYPLLLILAAVAIQLRLLCNLFDGMVAVEGGKSTASGELFNDIPDRLADPLILVGAGYAIAEPAWGSALGWCAGLLAVLVAYIRTLAASIGAPNDFRGPMAKQQRMAVITIACILAVSEPLFWPQGMALLIALLVIVLGCVITAARRALAAYVFLETNASRHD